MKRYTIIHSFLLSFFSKSLYQDVCKNWKGVAFIYLLLLLALCWLPTMFKVHSSISQYVINDAPDIIRQIPEILILNGEVSVEGQQPHIIYDPESDTPFIIIDTTGKITSLEDTEARFLLTKTNLIIKKNIRETRVFDLSEINEFHIDQTRISSWVETFKDWFAIVAYPFALLGSFLYRIIQVLIYAVIGLIFTKIVKSTLNYQVLLRLAIISITPAIIVDTIFSMLEVSVPFFGFLCFLIAMGYLFYTVKVNENVVVSA